MKRMKSMKGMKNFDLTKLAEMPFKTGGDVAKTSGKVLGSAGKRLYAKQRKKKDFFTRTVGF